MCNLLYFHASVNISKIVYLDTFKLNLQVAKFIWFILQMYFIVNLLFLGETCTKNI